MYSIAKSEKFLSIAGVAFTLAACGNNNEGPANNENPNKIHPVSETIPDSIKLVKASTLVPDVTPGNGSVETHDDSSRKQSKNK